ncbi:formylglycine-generating enzyme family protein [Aromatoleum toluclasticum]|uniref:formylglycine-generating enzyme family protein n=1 Tax=Aromatoleum toluclasticum TaxID=92003 RepID=UPI001D18460E|nr:SUMF1/EgtB/PvdO family nonheme iron enzyme [Aromatoleum toluclasticum]MCC4114393.1 formylglycine-generating enzyme family protein [Aromatoleum toluclasticum]
MSHAPERICRRFIVLTVLAWIAPAISASAPGDFSALPRTESPNLRKVKPPKHPRVLNEHLPRDEIEKLPLPKQPPALTAALLDLEKGSLDERIAKLKKKVVGDLVYVRGGSFMRGDFHVQAGLSASFTPNLDDKHVKKITLSDFWIGKYKVAYAEFDVFTDATGRKRTGMEHEGEFRHPILPAGAYWQEAKDYCQWLGEITGYPFDLPTEAQWEYAARSRGQFFATATDNGHLEYGRNTPHDMQVKAIVTEYTKSGWRYPVGLYPSNPLGLYDMAYLAFEWVGDWYAEDAYEKAASRDPRGPESGEQKVMRSWYIGNGQVLGTNIWRKFEMPVPNGRKVDGKYLPRQTYWSPTLRCAVKLNPLDV